MTCNNSQKAVHACMLSHSVVFDSLWDHQVPLSMGFPRAKILGMGCHLLLQGNLPDPRIEPTSSASLAISSQIFFFLTTEPLRNPSKKIIGFKPNKIYCIYMLIAVKWG